MTSEPSAVSTTIVAVLGLVFVLGFFATREEEERRFLLPLGVAAYSLKVLLIPIYYLLLVNAGLQGFGFDDAYEYHLDGIEIAGELTRGIDYSSRAWVSVDPGFPIFTGVVYWLLGPNTLAIRLINAVFSTVTLLFIYRMGRLAFEDRRVARWACCLAAFLPYSFIIAINHLKDPFVTLVATIIFYHAMRILLLEKNWLGSVAVVTLASFVMAFFRSGFVLPFIGILLVSYLLTQRSFFQAVALSIPTVLAMLAIQYLITDDVSVSFGASSLRLQGKLGESAQLAEVGGLVRLARMQSIWEFYKLPVATMLAVILPFPPFMSGGFSIVSLSWANLFNLAFLPHMIAGAWLTVRGPDWRRRVPLLLFPGVFLILIAMTHLGVERYRETVFPVMVILAAAGLVRGANLLLCIVVYSALVLVGGIVLIVRLS